MRIQLIPNFVTAALLSLSAYGCAATPAALEQTITLDAHNPLAVSRKGEQTLIPLALLNLADDTNNSTYVAQINGSFAPSQLVDTDADGQQDSLLLITDYAPNAKVRIHVSTLKGGKLNPQYTPLTQAEMGVRVGGKKVGETWQGGEYQQVNELTNPANHTIGDKLYKYEGFGWESDLMAYRFYFDERGLIDIFGKRTPDLVLHEVGLDGGDYHAMSDWGMDVLKVGPSLGLAGVAAWQNEAIQPIQNVDSLSVKLQSGPLHSHATVEQTGWKLGEKVIDLRRRYSINAHSHLTYVQAFTNQEIPQLAVGIVKHNVEKLSYLNKQSEWLYLATFGEQSLADDQLGMAIFFRASDLHKVTEDKLNELAVLNAGKNLDFYFAARWAGEASPITSKQQFLGYLETTRQALNNPIKVTRAK